VLIPSAYEDENGHMNIRHYFDLEAQAIAEVFDRMGITDDYRATRGQGFFTAEHHIRYYAEVHVGDRVSVHARIVERSDKVVHAMAFLVDDTTERLASTLEVTATSTSPAAGSHPSPTTSPKRSIGNSPEPTSTGPHPSAVRWASAPAPERIPPRVRDRRAPSRFPHSFQGPRRVREPKR
jgi:acyl-CoA thioesterase FadM